MEFAVWRTEVGAELFLPESLAAELGRGRPVRDRAVVAEFRAAGRAASGDQCLEVLAAARRGRAAWDAAEAEALAQLARLRGDERYVPDEAALELRISRHTADHRLAQASTLVTHLPGVLQLLRAGEFEGATAGRIAEIAAPLSPEHAAALDAALVGKLRSGRVSCLDPQGPIRAARRLVLAVDPDGAAERVRRFRDSRKVQLIPNEYAMSVLRADLPAEVAAAAYTRVDSIARKQRRRGDERTLDQLRADVLAALLLGQDPGATVPAVAAMVSIHLPATAALTMSEEGCELAGYGPIPAPIARALMAEPGSVLRKVLTDNHGRVTGVGDRLRRPNAALAALIRARDRECSMIGCHRPAPSRAHPTDGPATATTRDPPAAAPRRAPPAQTHRHPRLGVRSLTGISRLRAGPAWRRRTPVVSCRTPRRPGRALRRWRPCRNARSRLRAAPAVPAR